MAKDLKNNPYWNRWRSIQQAAYNPNNHNYIPGMECAWSTFDSFEKWISKNLGLPPTATCKLIRVNQHRGWVPGNLDWAEPKVLSNKMLGNCKFITYKKKTKSLTQWSEELGIPYWTLYRRIQNDWPLKDALSPKRFKKGER